MSFLEQHPSPRPWTLPVNAPPGFSALESFLGRGDNPLEVAVVASSSRPLTTATRELWKKRHGNTPSPLVLVALYESSGRDRAAICGPIPPEPAVLLDLDPGQVERLVASALAEPNRHAAIRFLQAALPEADSPLPGIRNIGMFATHELEHGVPRRPDWETSKRAGRRLLGLTGQPLIEGLGFEVEQRGTQTFVLRASGTAAAVAVFLADDETPEADNLRFDGTSAVSYALAKADAEQLPYVVITRGKQIRVYAARRDTGVGRKGRAETFIEANLALLPDDQAGYLPLLFGAEALRPAGSFEEVLGNSARFASELGTRLRERVYGRVVPALAAAVARHQHASGTPVSDAELAALYDQALNILFRLLFIAYAEDKDLLPFRSNDLYRTYALKTLAQNLANQTQRGEPPFDGRSTQLWQQLRALWHAVDEGNALWQVPRYNGGLFARDAEAHPAGAALERLTLTDAEVGPALFGLLVDETRDGQLGPVDFRSLSVREFGTIYEGLLESSLSIADSDLAIVADGSYVRATAKMEVVVRAGEIYIHNASGARKSSGSYFTKPLAVEHLLDNAIEPALDRHLNRVAELLRHGEEQEAADAFFDFRCVDLAMGSGHFLVAAVDRIEARLSSFLARHRIAGVTAELTRLRHAALDALGPDLAAGTEIEQASLLRRQIARRCIYGVDLNHIAVELARLALWVHTFVPGLPLSFLSHGLVEGNSLTGIGTIEEAVRILDPADDPDRPSLWRAGLLRYLERAREALSRLARSADATAQEVRDAALAQADARAAVHPIRQLFDLLVAARLGVAQTPVTLDDVSIARHPDLPAAERLAGELQVLHFPIVFPEVFLRERPGFDCIVGNPPWEEVVVEELQFWSTHSPGLKALSRTEQQRRIAELRVSRPELVKALVRARASAQRLREVLSASRLHEPAGGDPDLYRSFAWRFLALASPSATLGVVFPKAILVTKGSAGWRKEAIGRSGLRIVLARNRDEWLFSDVNPGYSIALVSADFSREPGVAVAGPVESSAQFAELVPDAFSSIPLNELRALDGDLAVPEVSSRDELQLLVRLSRLPRFGDRTREDWRALPVTELHATNDSDMFSSDGDPVFNHRNIGHFRFERDPGAFATAAFDEVASRLEDRRQRARDRRGPLAEMPREWFEDPEMLPCRQPRIAFRDVVHATNPRKVWAALVPPRTLLTNKAPYLVFPRGSEREQAYVLGMLNSSVVDWLAHRRVVLNLNFFILNSLPIPRMVDDVLTERFVSLAASLAELDEVWPSIPRTDVRNRLDAIAELDATAAILFGLSEDELALIWPKEPSAVRPSLAQVRDRLRYAASRAS